LGKTGAEGQLNEMDITERCRPKTLAGVIGQTTAINQIERIIESRGLAGSCWWFAGPTGIGKTTSARIIACGFTENNDCLIYEFVGRDMSVQDVRNLEARINSKPLMGNGRAIIINEAQDLSDSVVALLLATLEKIKLSKFDCIIFTAMKDVEKLSNERATHFRALVTRCYRPEFADTDDPDFQKAVVAFIEDVAFREGIKATDAREICEKAGWSIRDALARLDLCERDEKPGHETLMDYRNEYIERSITSDSMGFEI